MPRIIAGAVGGLPLKSVVGHRMRPTTDRVKEALFAQLDAIGMLEGAAVLDLCSGSGALALESVSRGARSADLVEHNATNYRFLQENIATVSEAIGKAEQGQERRADIRGHRSGMLRFLRQTATDRKWNVVFLDPPYSMENHEVTACVGMLHTHLAADGLVIVERSARDRTFSIPPAFRIYGVKKYGDTVLYWLEPAARKKPAKPAPG